MVRGRGLCRKVAAKEKKTRTTNATTSFHRCLQTQAIKASCPRSMTPCSSTLSLLSSPLRKGDTCSMADEAASAAAAARPVGAVGGQRELLVFQSVDDLCVSLARYTADLSDKCVREKGAFSVVLSGGYLIDCLRKLVESPYAESVDWAKWHVFWVDERAVRKDHVVNNHTLAYDGFLSKVPIPAEQVYGVHDSLPAEAAADDYEACLKRLVEAGVLKLSATRTGFPIFDLMLLGMGPDGHIASLFPSHPLLEENTRWVTFIKDSPKPPPQRITFTFPVINSSANIAMVVAGPGEAAAVSRALGDQHGPSNLLPVQMISPEDGKTTWFTDEEAVSKLQNKSYMPLLIM